MLFRIPYILFILMASFVVIIQTVIAIAPVGEDEGTPMNPNRGGGTRPENICPDLESNAIPIKAINANNGSDYTSQAAPTVWFYIPYSSDQLQYVEFIISDGREESTIYQTEVILLEIPGIINITLPNQSESNLKENELYRWYLNIYCQGNHTYDPDQELNGWIRRVEQPSNIVGEPYEYSNYREYRNNNIWYDAITTLIYAYQNDDQLKHEWDELLNAINQNNLRSIQNFVNVELVPVD